MSIADNISLSHFDLKVFELHNNGKSISQIAKELGTDEETVHDVIIDIWRMDRGLPARHSF